MNLCFEPGTVVPDLRSTDKFEALRELICRAPVFRELKMGADLHGGSCSAFAEAVVERERQQTTAFGHGVAVAHGRMEGVPRVVIAMGISRPGIPYDSPDNAPVHLLFVIASPPELSLDYLQALSTLVRCLREKSDRDVLLDAASAEEIEERMRAAFAARLERLEEPLPESAATATGSRDGGPSDVASGGPPNAAIGGPQNATFGGRGRTSRGTSG
jgi:PTS system nitrogen regulatory IIA component